MQSPQGTELEREDRLVKVVCYRIRMGLGNLQWRTGRRVKITYLIPKLAWPLGCQVESASRYWWLTHKNGVMEEGWFHCEDQWSPQRMEAEREDRLLQVVCLRVRDESP